MLQSVGLKNFTAEVLNSSEPVLVEFWHPRCINCGYIKPTIELVASQDRKVAILNVQEEPELTALFGVTKVPTMVVFKNGEAGPRLIGLRSAPQLVEMMDTA